MPPFFEMCLWMDSHKQTLKQGLDTCNLLRRWSQKALLVDVRKARKGNEYRMHYSAESCCELMRLNPLGFLGETGYRHLRVSHPREEAVGVFILQPWSIVNRGLLGEHEILRTSSLLQHRLSLLPPPEKALGWGVPGVYRKSDLWAQKLWVPDLWLLSAQTVAVPKLVRDGRWELAHLSASLLGESHFHMSKVHILHKCKTSTLSTTQLNKHKLS